MPSFHPLLSSLLVATTSVSAVPSVSFHNQLSTTFASKFPSPLSSPSLCLPKLSHPPSSSYICDPDGLLTSDGISRVEVAISRMHTLPIRVCGDQTDPEKPDRVEVAVVLIDAMSHIPLSYYPSSNADPDETDRYYLRAVKALAEAIHDSYGVGHTDLPSCPPSSSHSSGLLFLISRFDRTMHISTTSGIDAFLSSSRVTSVINAAKPHFRWDDLASGIVTALEATSAYLEKGPPGFREKYLSTIISLSFISAFFYAVIYSQKQSAIRRKEYNEAKMKLSKLEKEKAEALAGQYKCTSCPICLSDFPPPPSSPDTPRLGSDNKPVVLLRCGHFFDATCFASFLEAGRNADKCPICRADIAHGPAGDSSASTSASTSSSNSSSARPRSNAPYSYESHYDPELRFRLNNLRRRYPRFISQSQVNNYSSKNTMSFVSDPTFLRSSPTYSSPSSGRGSSTSHASQPSFGGGSSSGGGGGGRW